MIGYRLLYADVLSVHHRCDLLGAYSQYLLMSLKMQIKASQVLDDGKELNRWARQTAKEVANQIVLQSLLGACLCSTAHNAQPVLANNP